jgi:hypothetical protein
MNRTAGFTPETPLEIAPTGAFFVLMVAIDHYTSPDIPTLKNPVLDANNLLTVLRERYDLGIPGTDKALNLRTTDPLHRRRSGPHLGVRYFAGQMPLQ